MKVLKEFSKEQKVLSLPRRPMRNAVANGVTVSQSAVSNGATESKSPTEEQDLGDKVSPRSRQHSMRKSRVSGELEKDVSLSAVQSTAKLATTTPLNPVTPLRWKSTKRIESEKRKLQEEIKTKEVVKEERKNVNLAKEERKDQSKMAIASTGVNGIEKPHKIDSPTSNHLTSQDDKMFTSCASTSESTRMMSTDDKAENRKLSHPVTDGGSSEHAKHREEESSFNAKHGSDQTAGDNSGTDRKPLTGDESTAITIDFLRARLLAERASSKGLKERIQQLTKKVQELEGKLNQEIQFCRKAEEAEREALMKVESLNECKVSSLGENEALPQHDKAKPDQQIQDLDQADGKCQVPADMDDTRSNATVHIKPGLTQSAFLEMNELVVNEAEAIPTPEQEIGGHQCVQISDNNGSADVNHDGIPLVPNIASTNGDTYSPTSSELKRQEIRFSTEERLQHMWNQMAVEMGALAEDKAVEDRVREGLLKWMQQFPTVVQNILPKPSEEKKLEPETKTENMQQKGGDVPRENSDSDQALNSKEGSDHWQTCTFKTDFEKLSVASQASQNCNDSSKQPFDVVVTNAPEIVEERSLDGTSYSDGSRTHSKSLKKVASLIERFEANESIQREWEQSNAKQNSMSRRRSNEGSLSRTNSIPGTPSSIESQQAHRQDVSADEPPKRLLQVEDPSRYSLATDSSITLHEGMTAESLLITEDNSRVGTYTPGDSTPSTYPNSPVVGDKVRRSGGDRITPIVSHGTISPSLEHTEFGSQGSMDASFITPPLLSPSCRPKIGEKIGDGSINPEDNSHHLKQSIHRRAFDGNCLTPESHSERSSGEIREPTRSQALIGWVNLEEEHISPVLTNTGDHSSRQWAASIKGRHLQHERLTPYSQAGNSNAYIRPDHYPVRNDEREIYRGRMESVSRSMEGLGSSWRSLSDAEGDETQLFADPPDTIASSTSRRSGPQMPYQANGGSGWSNYYQPENMEGMSQSYAYPGRDFPRENFRSRSASSKIESTSSKVNEVLQALQLAKLSIKNSGTRRSTISSERSYAEGDRHNLRTDFGFSDGRISTETPTALRVWAHPEISRRHSTGTFRGAGSAASHLHPPNSAPFESLLDAHRKYPEDKYLTGRS